MQLLLVTILIISTWRTSSAFPRRIYYANETTLELVHVLFRHGHRTLDIVNLYPSNPHYTEDHYSPYGYGQLTNDGKMRAYYIGTALRRRYDNFLGKVWNMTILDIRSTDYNRTKMSAELVTAGLWPPNYSNIWNPVLLWQPIPYNFEKIPDDKELSPFLACNTFNELFNENLENTVLGDYMIARYNETINILVNRTGLNKITYLKAFLIYFGFFIQQELNLPLEDWTSAVYPEPLHSLVMDYYYLASNNTQLRKVGAGYLLKKIISDTQRKIDSTLIPPGRKMFIYSAHETTMVLFLFSLEIQKMFDPPPYGANVLLEVHRIDEVYGIKLFYQDYSSDDPKLLQLPGCADFCPIDEFINLVQKILPASDEECYGSA